MLPCVWYYSEKWGSKTKTSQENCNDEGEKRGGEGSSQEGGKRVRKKKRKRVNWIEAETADASVAMGGFLSSAHTWLSADRAADSGLSSEEWQESWCAVRLFGNVRNKEYPPHTHTHPCCLERCTVQYFTITAEAYKTLIVSVNLAKPLQCVLHNITCFTAPRFPHSSGMMSSSQDTEQEGHYFVRRAVMFTSVKPGDAGNETREDFEKALRCA